MTQITQMTTDTTHIVKHMMNVSDRSKRAGIPELLFWYVVQR